MATIGAVAGITGLVLFALLSNGLQLAAYGLPGSVIARLRESDGSILTLRTHHLGATSISQADDGSMAVTIRKRKSRRAAADDLGAIVKRFEGAEAQRVMSILVPRFNQFGGDKYDVAIAASEIEAAGSAQRFVDSITRRADEYSRTVRELRKLNPHRSTEFTLGKLRTPQQLALEMALHEEAERRAFEGELAELERAWRDAEEIAAIADSLTLPDSVNTALDNLKKP